MKYQALTVPDWFRENAVYQINPRTFSDEGTLCGLIHELPFIKSLGFNIIYLCPVYEEDVSEDVTFWSERQLKYETGNPKNPYRMRNYFNVDSEYGTTEDLKEFVRQAHELDLKVLIDIVYLHMGPNAPILLKHPEFAIQDENGVPVRNRYNFVNLDFNCQGLREYLWTHMIYMLTEIDVDGFRCDVGDKIPNDFWAEGRRRIHTIKPDAILINEGRDMARLANTFDACYGIQWEEDTYMVFEGNKNVRELIDGYDEIAKDVPARGVVMRALDNHDRVTDWPQRAEVLLGHDGMELVQVMNYVIDGVPMVYAGNELADTARVNMFANRFHMGAYEVTDRSKKNTPESMRRQDVYKQLNSFRKDCDAITKGTMKWMNNLITEDVMAFAREYQGQKLVFIANFGATDVRIAEEGLSVGTVILENHCSVTAKNICLGAYGYVVLEF